MYNGFCNWHHLIYRTWVFYKVYFYIHLKNLFHIGTLKSSSFVFECYIISNAIYSDVSILLLMDIGLFKMLFLLLVMLWTSVFMSESFSRFALFGTVVISLKYGWSKLPCAINVKYIPYFEDLRWKKYKLSH